MRPAALARARRRKECGAAVSEERGAVGICFRAAVAAVRLLVCLVLQRGSFERHAALHAIELCTCSSPECRPCGDCSGTTASVARAVRRYAKGLEHAVSDSTGV